MSEALQRSLRYKRALTPYLSSTEVAGIHITFTILNVFDGFHHSDSLDEYLKGFTL